MTGSRKRLPVPPIAPSRKIPCVPALAALALLALPATAPAQGRLEGASLSQAGRELIFTVRTGAPVALARLEPRPDPARASARYLCLEMRRRATAVRRRLCLGGPRAHRRIGVEVLDGDGRVVRAETAPARVKRPVPTKLVVAIEPREAGLSPHRYAWRVVEAVACAMPGSCWESLPRGGSFAFRLRPVRPVGCTGGTPGLVTNGSRGRRVVALTFDDGPSEYTPAFLRVLREKNVPGTFFEVGQEMPGREDVMRQILAAGDEIGDHTMNHVEYPGFSQIAGAAARVAAYTHFEPCLFRPPGGAVDAAVVASAGNLGMRTVDWDVDPRDWSLPGSAAIYSNILSHAQPGSIILMHDGGGPRGETLAALPRVIDSLRARGYGFVTVTQLLGDRILYRPFG